MARMERLIRRAQQGDSRAVAALYNMFAHPIYRYIAYRVSSPADAEDLTAEVFVRMVEGLPAYRWTGAPFEAWLYRIAAARIIDFRRRAGSRQMVELSEDLTDAAPTPEVYTTEQQELASLRQAVQQLPDEQQTILLLRFVERKRHEEIAALLGKSMTAVKAAQYRALMQLVSVLGSGAKARHYLRGRRD